METENFKINMFDEDEDYKSWLEVIKSNIKITQIRTSLKANSGLIYLYWNLGKAIVKKQSKTYWGDGLIKQLSKVLSSEFPDIKGFSERNLAYIKQWFTFYNDIILILQQPVAELEDYCRT